MVNLKYLELLSPARNADTGIEAIRHGADAVYIGATAFGARSAAANQLDDIRRLVAFAHPFHAKVYVTVNTIIYDDELPAVQQLITDLYAISVDALIVQDMAVARLNIPPIPLHVSTQMDNRTPEKIRALAALGYEQVVLARELSLNEIAAIHAACPDVRLEAFVHGALCVSYSGQCFVSQALFKRSANRGECAQVCRMEFDLENDKGEKLIKGKHLLSLKDLCQLDCLEQMAEAGVTSFKIEGRLKDTAYVKNVTAAYSQRLNQLVARFPGRYARASRGTVRLDFQPDVSKSFNRGFTHYFLFGKNDDIFAFDSPKAMGKRVGRIREVFTNHIMVEPLSESSSSDGSKKKKISFANGDGLCCLAADGKLIGFRVNRVDADRLFPLKMPQGLRRGMTLFRNYDKRFEETLAADSAERTIPVAITIDYDKPTSSFILSIQEYPNPSEPELSEYSDNSDYSNNSDYSDYSDNSKYSVNPGISVLRIPYTPDLARTPQRDNILRQFSKLGNTPLRLEALHINYTQNFFIPSSLLTQWRRQLTDLFLNPVSPSDNKQVQNHRVQHQPQVTTPSVSPSSLATIASNPNIANHLARDFYVTHGVNDLPPAFELHPSPSTPLMTCRHCIRYSLGWCPNRQSSTPTLYQPNRHTLQPLFLTLRNGIRLALHFDCTRCLMTLHLIT